MKELLLEKADELGLVIEKIETMPDHVTSQDCSVCGWRNKDLQLKDRAWTCINGHTLERDLNAAINIRNKGVGHTPSAWEKYSDIGRVAQESHLL